MADEIIWVNQRTDRSRLAARTIKLLREMRAVQWIGPSRVAGLLQAAAADVVRHVPDSTSVGTEKYPPTLAALLGRDGPEQAQITWVPAGVESDGPAYWIKDRSG